MLSASSTERWDSRADVDSLMTALRALGPRELRGARFAPPARCNRDRSETTAPTMRSEGEPSSAARTREAMSASVPSTTRWCSQVPASTAAASVPGALPASMRARVASSNRWPAMKRTSVSARARCAQSGVSLARCAVANVTVLDSPRWVTGMAAAAGTAARLETPGTTS